MDDTGAICEVLVPQNSVAKEVPLFKPCKFYSAITKIDEKIYIFLPNPNILSIAQEDTLRTLQQGKTTEIY